MKELDMIGKELSRHVKTQKDLTEVMDHLTKTMLESILNAELDSHLGYEKNEKAKECRNNTRNGYSEKTLKTEHGELEIRMPRDRSASFEPAIVPKGKTRLDGFEDTILTLYAQGLSVRQIRETIRDLYHGAEISTESYLMSGDRGSENMAESLVRCGVSDSLPRLHRSQSARSRASNQ